LYAIEVFPPHVEILRQRGIHVVSLDLERDAFPFDDESIDVLLANQILEHTKEVFWIFHEMSPVLATGGHLIIGVPNLASLHNRLLLLRGRQPTVVKTASAHVRGFTKCDLLNFLAVGFPNGFDLQEQRGANFYPFPPTIANPLARLLPNLAWGLFLRFEKQRPYLRQFLEFPGAPNSRPTFILAPEVVSRHGAYRWRRSRLSRAGP
jgi:SAM-dependent methyltransferase